MIWAFSDTIWMAIGIALNPVAIIIGMLIENRDNRRRNGAAYLLGWLCGLAVLITVPTLILHDRFGLASGRRPDMLAHAAQFRAVLGILLLILAAAAFVRGPLPGDQVQDPRWARAIDGGSVWRMFGMGAFVSIVNLRNLVLLAAAISIISQADLDLVAMFIVLGLFVVLASIGVLFPLLISIFGNEAQVRWLREGSSWLTRHMGMITGVIMGLFGVMLLTGSLRLQ